MQLCGSACEALLRIEGTVAGAEEMPGRMIDIEEDGVETPAGCCFIESDVRRGTRDSLLPFAMATS